jgi:hypothetical protein
MYLFRITDFRLNPEPGEDFNKLLDDLTKSLLELSPTSQKIFHVARGVNTKNTYAWPNKTHPRWKYKQEWSSLLVMCGI